MRQIIESTTARPKEQLMAAKLLYKVRYSAPKGKPRGRHVQKTRIRRFDDILNQLE
jgi:hypothetical protein